MLDGIGRRSKLHFGNTCYYVIILVVALLYTEQLVYNNRSGFSTFGGNNNRYDKVS